MAASVRRVAGKPKLPVTGFPWWLVVALSPVVRVFGEMAEMRYLWREPMALDDRKLRAFLGYVPHTPLDRAVEGSLRALGCLEVSHNVNPLPAGEGGARAVGVGG
jgi:nucleoside-diphosphate-sugar epimerase